MSEQKDNQPTKISPEIKPDPKMIQSGLFNSLGVEIVFTNKEKSPLIGIKRDEIVKTKNNNFNTEPKFYFEKENYRLGDELIHVIQKLSATAIEDHKLLYCLIERDVKNPDSKQGLIHQYVDVVLDVYFDNKGNILNYKKNGEERIFKKKLIGT